MLEFQKIRWKNFLSTGDNFTEILFDKSPTTLILGANGAGKTTTCGKLAKFFKSMGRSVMLASGDTFRAAATSQLDFWGV